MIHKLEVGKRYKTRNGKFVFTITLTDELGQFYGESPGFRCVCFDSYGNYYVTPGWLSEYDLVMEIE